MCDKEDYHADKERGRHRDHVLANTTGHTYRECEEYEHDVLSIFDRHAESHNRHGADKTECPCEIVTDNHNNDCRYHGESNKRLYIRG